MKYNTIVIGGGLAGLVAGATLTKFGKKVLLLEQHFKPGGCATTFKRGDFIMEVGLHEINGLDETDFKAEIYKMLEVDKHVQFDQVPELYVRLSKNGAFVFPHGYKEATEALVKKYPKEEKGIKRFMKVLSGIRSEIRKLPLKKWKRKLYFPLMPLLYPNTVEASRHSVGSWLDKYISDEELKLDLTTHLAYFADNPYTLSMYFYGMAFSGFVAGGGHYIKGGSQNLPDYLASYIEKNGGTVLLGKKAQKINTVNNHVTSVTFSDSFNTDTSLVTMDCDNVLANCALPLVPKMLDEPYAGLLERKIAPYEVSCSIMSIYIGFNTDLKAFGVNHYSNYISGDDIHTIKDIYPNFQGDWSKRSFIFVDYSKVDAQLAPVGKSVGAICTVDYLKDWENLSAEDYKAKKEKVAEVLLQRLEKQFPGIRDGIEYFEMATPKTILHYTLNPRGTAYGYAETLQQSGFKRLRNNFLIPNLYFASAWTFPGGGFAGTINGGFLAAVQMNRDKIWSSLDADQIADDRMVQLVDKKEIDKNIMELSFEKPAKFKYNNGEMAILRLIHPKFTELDLPYRWLHMTSAPKEPALKFTVHLNNSSFDKNCKLLKTGDKALIFGPMR